MSTVKVPVKPKPLPKTYLSTCILDNPQLPDPKWWCVCQGIFTLQTVRTFANSTPSDCFVCKSCSTQLHCQEKFKSLQNSNANFPWTHSWWNVWFQKISIPTPRRVTEIPRGGGSKSGNFPKGRGVKKEFSFQRVSSSIEWTNAYLPTFLIDWSNQNKWSALSVDSHVSNILCAIFSLVYTASYNLDMS